MPGVVWHRKLFGTGDAARARGEDAGGWHLVGRPPLVDLEPSP